MFLQAFNILLFISSFGFGTSFPQNEPGYNIEEPEQPFKPTVPPPPPADPVQQLYSAPQTAAADSPNVRVQDPPPAAPPAPPPQPMQGMPYEFEWGVNDIDSGNMYSHVESSDGNVAQGEYKVLLPDGRLQIVTFFDRGNGFEAEVTYQDTNNI